MIKFIQKRDLQQHLHSFHSFPSKYSFCGNLPKHRLGPWKCFYTVCSVSLIHSCQKGQSCQCESGNKLFTLQCKETEPGGVSLHLQIILHVCWSNLKPDWTFKTTELNVILWDDEVKSSNVYVCYFTETWLYSSQMINVSAWRFAGEWHKFRLSEENNE